MSLGLPDWAKKHGYTKVSYNKGRPTYTHTDGHAVGFDKNWKKWTHSSNKAEHKAGSSVTELDQHLSKFHQTQHTEEGNYLEHLKAGGKPKEGGIPY